MPPASSISLVPAEHDSALSETKRQESVPKKCTRAMWPGCIVEIDNDADYVKERESLADAAYLGRWDEVFRALENGQRFFNENWSNAVRLSS